MNSPESAAPGPRIQLAPRSPDRAALLSAFAPGAGQIYNKQLEKAVLIWIWYFILVVLGIVLLVLGMLGRWLPASKIPPPLSGVISGHAGAVFWGWAASLLALWLWNMRDACVSASRINRGEIVIRHPMRWQVVHVLGSQLLGFIPLIGFLFPPGMVAEAMDSYREGRRPDHDKVLHEGGMALVEWTITRAAFYALWILIGAWVLWWILRAIF